MKNTISNQEIARAATIYYAKKEGEKLARKKAAADAKAQRKAEKAAKKAKKAVDEFTDSVKDLNSNSEQQDQPEVKVEKKGFFGGVFKKKEDIIDVEAVVVDAEPEKQEEQPVKEEAKQQPKKEEQKPVKTNKSEVEVVSTEKKDAGKAAREMKEAKKQEGKKTADVKQEKGTKEQPKAQAEKKAEETPVEAVDPAEKEHPEDDPPEEVNEAKKEEPKQETEVVETVKAQVGKPVEADKAAHNLGFNIQNFIKEEEPVQQTVPMHTVIGQQPVHVQAPNVAMPTYQQPTPQQQTASVVNPVNYFMNQPVEQQSAPADISALYPINYEQLGPAQKCDVIKTICTSHPELARPFDPMAGQSTTAKIEELKKHIKFIEGKHKGVDEIQIAGLLSLINNPMLRTKMTEYGSKDRPNNPKLYEVEIGKYGQPGDEAKFDMCFEINLKDKKHYMFVLFNSVPVYNPNTRSWNHVVEFGKK